MDLIDLAERAVLPDWLIRVGMRPLLAARLKEQSRRDGGQPGESLRQFIAELCRSPIAIATTAANEQHDEVPSEFFQRVLGPRLKYSCCYWPRADATLPEAEDAMLEDHWRFSGSTTPAPLRHGWPSATASGPTFCNCSRQRSGGKMPPVSSNGGGCSSWPARSSSPIGAGTSGSSPTTSSQSTGDASTADN
jgi:hypothetical protein